MTEDELKNLLGNDTTAEEENRISYTYSDYLLAVQDVHFNFENGKVTGWDIDEDLK